MTFAMRSRRIRALRVIPALLLAAAAHGEAVFTGSGVTLSGDMAIDAAQGTVRGGNVFHSFSVFNVLSRLGERVVFSGPGEIRNVISRVTGGTSDITGLKSSLIDGPLSVSIPGANFYFMNPNGIIIGANGSINASGSVYLSTAHSLKLADGVVFDGDPSKDHLLTTANPVSFGFLANPAPITLDGPFLNSPVPPGKTFALIGGDIVMQASGGFETALLAFGATVSLASAASAGEALLGAGGLIDMRGFDTLGHVNISGGSFVFVSDPGFSGDGSSGSIYIRAGQLSLAPGGLLAQTYGDTPGGVIDIAVRGDLVAGTDPVSGIISVIQAGSDGGLGRGADIRLDVGGTLRISDGSFVINESYGPGAAGDIHIRAGAIEIRGQGPRSFTGISADNYGAAAGPSLSITTTGGLQLLNGGFAGTRNFGPGTGGALTISADSVLATGAIDPDSGAGLVTLSLSTETTGGAAGDMTLTTRTLELRDGARISSSTGGPGDAGSLIVNASERVDISGGLSGIFTATAAGPAGNAGALSVTTPVLALDGGVIDSTTVGDGNAGSVSVQVGSLQLGGGGQIRSFSGGFDETNNDALVVGTGSAGSVNVVASGAVTISGNSGLRPSGLLTETRGSGAGGDVQVQASTLVLTDGGTISSSTRGSGAAGGVNVVVGDTVTISGVGERGPSGLFAETTGSGAGGDVRVQAMVLRLLDGGSISSSSLSSGLAGNIEARLGDSLEMFGGSIATRALTSDGGNIAIYAPRLIRLVGSQITTSVESGVGGGGNIFIDPQFMLLQNSQIIANAFGGPGGNIGIVAGQLIADPSTIISASSALGIDGAVNIEAPDTDVSASLAVLPASFLDAASLLRAGCTAARAGLSSLVEVGRGGLPPDPDGYLPSMDLGTLASVTAGVARAQPQLAVSGFTLSGLLASYYVTDCGS